MPIVPQGGSGCRAWWKLLFSWADSYRAGYFLPRGSGIRFRRCLLESRVHSVTLPRGRRNGSEWYRPLDLILRGCENPYWLNLSSEMASVGLDSFSIGCLISGGFVGMARVGLSSSSLGRVSGIGRVTPSFEVTGVSFVSPLVWAARQMRLVYLGYSRGRG